MRRVAVLRRFVAAAAALAALLLPATSAAGAGPGATKSGAVISYLTTGKLEIGKRIVVPFKCAVNCDLTSTVKLKGPSVRGSDTETASLDAGVRAGHIFHPSRRALRLLQAAPREYHLISNITATDRSTGAKDTITHRFGLTRAR